MESRERQQQVTKLIEQHHEVLYRVAFRLTGRSVDAEDLTQQTFLTAQQKLHQLRDEDRSRSWLLAILRHHFFRNWSKSQTANVPLSSVPEPSQVAEESGEYTPDELQAALNELPDEFRFPLVLFYFRELSYQEIAAELSVPLGTVMSRLSRGKNHLRRRLLGDFETESPQIRPPVLANRLP